MPDSLNNKAGQIGKINSILSYCQNHNFFSDLIGAKPLKPTRGTKIATLSKWGPSWNLEFELKIHQWPTKGYHNILRVSDIEGNCCLPGQRQEEYI